ncbi:hypothetical protein ACET3Z_019826 [Daucus carota]
MPTPVSTARECLTEESARVLDDAVSVARRRSHSQTTSLHIISALLSMPNSTLKEACQRNRGGAYSPRLQLRALELSVGVSLDRLPSAKTQDESESLPPISNSLMAAIKRSQANQRRHPETFHLYQQTLNQTHQNGVVLSVKVELKHFVLSILDDPIVSRVLGEAGFRSSDLKISILQPPAQIRYPPPLFLCNLVNDESKRCRFSFPFAIESVDENSKRISEVLVKKNKKNPILIGFCAKDALKGFRESVKNGKVGVLDKKIEGLSSICIEDEVSEFVLKNGSEEMMGGKFDEVGDVLEKCRGCGVVVDFGELGVFVKGVSIEGLSYVVSRLSNLVRVYGEKIWLMGFAESYEIYMKFVERFPTIEKDWDLHMLPITASTPLNGGSYSKSSLLGSFVPFGGFFPAPPEINNLLESRSQSAPRCDMCNKKYEQEVSSVLKGGSTTSVAAQDQLNLPSWLQMDDIDKCKSANPSEVRDGGVQNARLAGLQRKWNDICQRLHHPRSLQQEMSKVGSLLPAVGSYHSDAKRKDDNGKDCLLNECIGADPCSCISSSFPKISSRPKQYMEIPVTSVAEIPVLQNQGTVEVSSIREPEMNHKEPSYPICSPLLQPGLTSSSSVTSSVTTDLGLGTLYASCEQEHRSSKSQDFKELPKVSWYIPAKISGDCTLTSANDSMQTSFRPSLGGQSDDKDFKYLWKVLSDTVGWQEEAISTISQTISSCRNGYGRLRGQTYKRDIWLSFLGPDKVGKRRIAGALAQISRGDLFSVDLDPVNCFSLQNSIFDYPDSSSNNLSIRGKTIVGYIAEKLSRKPYSIVLLENIDKAYFITQRSLTQAIKTGRFPDSDGREINISNMIFVTTLSRDINVMEKGPPKFTENKVLGAKGLQMKIFVEGNAVDIPKTRSENVLLEPMKGTSNQVSVNKRKITDEIGNSPEVVNRFQKVSRTCLDLNLPVEDTEDDDYGACDSHSSSESSDVWLEDFLEQVDQKVVFKPFDFETLAQKILKNIEKSFRETIGFDILLEIDSEVMLQMLAAAWLSNERAVENWVEQVICKSFVEVKQKHHIASGSVLKLVALEGLQMGDKAPNLNLPANISVN